MSRRLPPLNALRAAEAVHRLGGVAAAARALHVSQPAVSQHLRSLEADLGQPLFARVAGRLVPTAAGAILLPRLTQAFAQIEDGIRLIDMARNDGPLTVAVLATFAMRWLIPRLGQFQDRWPAIDLRLATAAEPVDKLVEGGADIAVGFGRGPEDWPGLTALPLMPEVMFPVAAPDIAARLEAPLDLARVTRLEVEAPLRARDWAIWLDAAGVAGLEAPAVRRFESSSQAIAAAVAGLGVLLTHGPFVTDDLAAGRLIQPFGLTVQGPLSYWLVHRPGRERRDDLRHFRDWLRAAGGDT
jgi:DNA-binding transcriptional LysR family regulator